MSVIDLRTGLDSRISPGDGPSDSPKWSRDSSHVAIRVGEGDGSYQELEGEDGSYLLASAVRVIDVESSQVYRAEIPEKTIGGYTWTGDSRHLVLVAATSEKGKHEEWGWRLVGEGVYMVELDGDTQLLVPGGSGAFIGGVSYHVPGWLTLAEWGATGRSVAIQNVDKLEAGEVPTIVDLPGTPIGAAGDNLITMDAGGRMYMITPGGAVEALGRQPERSRPVQQTGAFLIFEHQRVDGDFDLRLVPVGPTK